ncbi:transporter, major facilitator family protein [Blautia hydrogenotrophica DSM 10507]|uniref:Major facilitator superfamily (MFS) profile domain-containing protein n=4 Tax=Blautia hydrogenotrophica TaxID=53443 RepID=C0CHC7_BLAHS|nr:transporter, major facilitator family protein [Blautia hydrogenotrophica DSM 10507]
MNNKIRTYGGFIMNQSFVKKYGTLLLLAAGAGIIFQLPYIRETFYPQIQAAMNLSNAQMGLLSSGYATVALLSYFIGGIVADRFSARKLLTFSFLATGALGLWFSTFPSYNVARVIFVLMGISTIITYWSACIKATRMLGTPEEQGRLFGLQEGLRGILNALLVFGMTAAYSFFAVKSETLGTSMAIKVCSITVIIIGILNFIFIEDTKKEENTESLGSVVKGMFKALTIPRVWVLVAIIFTAYSVYGLIGYVNTYAVQYYDLSAAMGSTLGGIRYLLQGVGGIIGGFLADRLHSRIKVIAGGCILLAISFGLFIVLPVKASLLVAVIINFFFGLIFIYAVRSQYFAVHDDAGIPLEMSGRVSGIASALGFAPDLFLYTLVGGWMDTYGAAGFKMTWAYAVVASLLCVVMAFVLSRIIKKNASKANA